MKIVIPTIGSRGDMQPYIALAQGLERAGHTVTLMSHPVMRALVESHSVKFVPMGPDIDLGRGVVAIRAQSPLGASSPSARKAGHRGAGSRVGGVGT